MKKLLMVILFIALQPSCITGSSRLRALGLGTALFGLGTAASTVGTGCCLQASEALRQENGRIKKLQACTGMGLGVTCLGLGATCFSMPIQAFNDYTGELRDIGEWHMRSVTANMRKDALLRGTNFLMAQLHKVRNPAAIAIFAGLICMDIYNERAEKRGTQPADATEHSNDNTVVADSDIRIMAKR